jgi:hypothetical protein
MDDSTKLDCFYIVTNDFEKALKLFKERNKSLRYILKNIELISDQILIDKINE